MFYSDDPVKDYERYDARQQRRLARRPRCCECHDYIQDDVCYEKDNGDLICPRCLEANHERNTDDYID